MMTQTAPPGFLPRLRLLLRANQLGQTSTPGTQPTPASDPAAAAAQAAQAAQQAAQAAQQAAQAAQAAQAQSQQAGGVSPGIQQPQGFSPPSSGPEASDLAINGALVQIQFAPPAGSTGTPQTATAMIDTGASISGILPALAQAAGGVQVSSVDIGGVTGSSQAPIYALKVTLPAYNITFDVIDVAGVQLPQQNIQALIGRDMLAKMNLTYDGPDAVFQLASPPGQASPVGTYVAGGVAALAFASLIFLAKGRR